MSEKTDWFCIINPNAGNGKSVLAWATLSEQMIAENISFSFVNSEYSGHTIQLTQQAIQQGFRRILAVGGDGTVHEVVNGIFGQSEVPTEEIIVTMYPIGTGNDWLKTHQISSEMNTFIQKLKDPNSNTQCVGKIEYQSLQYQTFQRYFFNVAGMAYDGYVAKKLSENRKAAGNQLTYFLMVFKYLFQYTISKLEVIIQHETFRKGKHYLVNVGICKFSGGGMQLTPHAQPDSGKFAVTCGSTFSALKVIMNLYRLYQGSILEHPLISSTHSEQVTILPLHQDDVYLEADGEFLGKCPATFVMEERRLRFC